VRGKVEMFNLSRFYVMHFKYYQRDHNSAVKETHREVMKRV
jgi:hypothetical protein